MLGSTSIAQLELVLPLTAARYSSRTSPEDSWQGRCRRISACATSGCTGSRTSTSRSELFQLAVSGLTQDFLAPRTLEAPTNLPAQVTDFIGRKREVQDIADLLRHSRLLTLTGPGGTGKTRLALQVASQVRWEFSGGAFFADLSLLTDPALIPTTIASALGVREQPDQPLLASLKAHLRDRRLLLVLDNYEQLQTGAALVAELIEAAPDLVVLATSREVLHLRGEQEFPVPPLGLPDSASLSDLGAVAQYDAVALFIRRAQAARPDFEIDNLSAPAVAGICARLDGLPLAIELAAARVKLLDPEAILRRLEGSLSLLTSTARDLTERQRTLRGAIDWSYDLLDPTERILFRRLGIFVGGCSIERAQEICDGDGRLGIDMLDGLTSLTDKSLLRRLSPVDGEPRFGMLETVREYALERLTESPDWDIVRHRFEDLFAALALQSAGEIMGTDQKAWADRLESERDNLRAAIQRLADDGLTERALDMGAALWRFWQMRGNLAEGRGDARGSPGAPRRQRADLGPSQGAVGPGRPRVLAVRHAGAERAYVEGLEIERSQDDPAGLAEALYNLGFVRAISGKHAEARTLYEEALEIASRHWLTSRPSCATRRRSPSSCSTWANSHARAASAAELAAFKAAQQTFRAAVGSGFLSYLETTGRSIRDRSRHAARGVRRLPRGRRQALDGARADGGCGVGRDLSAT